MPARSPSCRHVLHALLEPGARAGVVADEAPVDAEVVQLPDHAAQIAQLAIDRQRVLAGAGRLEHRREHAGKGDRRRACLRPSGQAGQPQQGLEAGKAFEAVVAAIPVVGERERQTQGPIGVVGADQMVERGAMVVVLAPASLQPRPHAAPPPAARAPPPRGRCTRPHARAASPGARRSRRAARARTRGPSRASRSAARRRRRRPAGSGSCRPATTGRRAPTGRHPGADCRRPRRPRESTIRRTPRGAGTGASRHRPAARGSTRSPGAASAAGPAGRGRRRRAA